MYQNLGIHWASSIPAFLALMCVPFPFLFYKYGRPIRMRCKFAAEAAKVLEHLKGEASKTNGRDEEEGQEVPFDEETNAEQKETEGVNTTMGAEPAIDEKVERGEKVRGGL
jgi:hypothetical protein